MTLKVHEVSTRQELRHFIYLPWIIYRGDQNWVPPLLLDEKARFNRKKSPFFTHSEASFFLARENGNPVGRIAAILNTNHNTFHNEKTCFFGFFECIDSQEVAEALFEKVKEYARSKKMEILRGPMNYSTNETCGLLVKGFDSPPYVLMPYNPVYYPRLIEDAGFTKTKDLYAYYLTSTIFSKRVVDLSKKIARRYNISVRTASMKHLREEVERVRTIYNAAWEKNWGFVPMTDEEFDHMAKELKPIVNPRLCLFAEVKGEPVGFSLGLPDWNQALIHLNGRLFPFGILKLLYYKNKTDALRVITMGVIEQYRHKGIETLLNARMLEEGVATGMPRGEMSWVLEDNVMMNKGMETLGADRYKTYRIYDFKV